MNLFDASRRRSRLNRQFLSLGPISTKQLHATAIDIPLRLCHPHRRRLRLSRRARRSSPAIKCAVERGSGAPGGVPPESGAGSGQGG
jgi:hypothetical protein